MPHFATALKGFLTLFLIVYIINITSFRSLLDSFVDINALWVVLAAFLWFLQLVLSSFRWLIVAREQGIDISPWSCFKFYYIACLVGVVMPATVGMDAARARLLSRGKVVPLSHALRSVVKDRLLSTITMILVVVLSLPFLCVLIDDPLAKKGLVMAIGALVIAVAGVLCGERLWCFVPWVGKHLSLVSAETRALLKNKSIALRVISLGIIIQILVSCQFWCLGLGVRFTAPWYMYFAIVPAISTLTMLPVTINGWGMRETALYKGFSLVGIVSPLAVTLSILYGILSTVTNLGAAPLLLQMSLGRVSNENITTLKTNDNVESG